MSAPPSPSQPVATQGKRRETPTAMENRAFLNSSAGRSIRLLAEFEEFPRRMRDFGIRGTFLFFGSARAPTRETFTRDMAALREKIASPVLGEREKEAAIRRVEALEKQEWMIRWMEVTEELARLLTVWSMSPEGVEVGRIVYTHFPDGTNETQPLIVCTGGGPGFMVAGNKGAFEAGGLSMGVGVNLPFETELNQYVTEGLNFQMEYFFTRKFWEVFCAKAMICAPGGMGTCDEMFEVLTLMQTQHCPKMPVVLLGSEFWRDIINFDKMAKYGVISQQEVDSICFADDAQTAFDFIRKALVEEAEAMKHKGQRTPPPSTHR